MTDRMAELVGNGQPKGRGQPQHRSYTPLSRIGFRSCTHDTVTVNAGREPAFADRSSQLDHTEAMSEETPKAASNTAWMWAGVMVAACIVYGAGITREGLWYDEAYSAAMVEHPALEIIRLTPNDVHPPLYYLLLRGVRVMLGNSEWALRLLSVLGAVALVGLGAGPIRRMCGDATAGIYAVTALFTPAILIYAHEARMYTLLAFAVNAAVVYGYLAVRDNKTFDWVCLGLSSVAAAYLHYYGAIAVFYLHLSLGVWLLRKGARALKPLLITAVCVFLAYLPWVALFLMQAMRVRRGFWISAVDSLTVLGAFCVPFTHKDFFPGVSWSAAAVTGLCYALIVFGGAFSLAKRKSQEWNAVVLTAVVFNATLLTTIVVSLVFAPVFLPRYMLACLGPVLIALSIGISLLPTRLLWIAAVILFAGLNLFTGWDLYTQQFNGPAREMARDLKGDVTPNDLIVTSDCFAMGPALYYMRDAHHLCYVRDWQVESFRIFGPQLVYQDHLSEELSTRTRFWYIASNSDLSCPASEILKGSYHEWEISKEPKYYAHPYSRYDLTVTKYTRTDRTAKRSPERPGDR